MDKGWPGPFRWLPPAPTKIFCSSRTSGQWVTVAPGSRIKGGLQSRSPEFLDDPTLNLGATLGLRFGWARATCPKRLCTTRPRGPVHKWSRSGPPNWDLARTPNN